MKRVLGIIAALVTVACFLSACGSNYVCTECDKTISKAYYDLNGDYLCKDCAKEYWIPLDYEDYRVK